MPSLPSFGDTKPVEIKTKALDKTPLNLAEPEPITTTPFVWYIVTPENYQEVFKKIAEEGKDVVVFGLSDDGYADLAILFADMRNHINQQRIIIQKYKEYYEGEKDKVKSDEK
jgi:predicted membrane-bound mannosyltransferase